MEKNDLCKKKNLFWKFSLDCIFSTLSTTIFCCCFCFFFCFVNSLFMEPVNCCCSCEIYWSVCACFCFQLDLMFLMMLQGLQQNEGSVSCRLSNKVKMNYAHLLQHRHWLQGCCKFIAILIYVSNFTWKQCKSVCGLCVVQLKCKHCPISACSVLNKE